MGTSTVMVGHCQKCHAPIGELTREELDYVVFEAREQLLCFNCDPEEAKSIPALFLEWEQGDKLCVSGELFPLEWNVVGYKFPPQSHAHASARARGLSSVTYLNGFYKESVVLDKLTEFAPCPECDGVRGYYQFQNGPSCVTCSDHGSIRVLAKWVLWLVNGVRENA